jgi:ankyrin repeat protein
LIFPELQKKAAESKRVLLRIIDSLPRSVDEIYEKILNQSNDFARAQKLLHIVVAAMRPLTVEEMNIALSIQHDDTCFDEIDLTPPASFAPILRELCGLFVYIIDSRIYLAHRTAKDFLQKPTKASDKSPTSDKWKHSLDPKESNKTIAWSCIRYLLLDVFEHGLFPRRDADLFEVQEPADPVLGCVPSLGNPLAPYRIHRLVRKRPARHGRDDNLKTVPTSDRILQKAINRHPFLEYSAKYWSLHSISAEDEEAFLQVTLQLWQIDVPRGALWFAICCSPYYVPRLPAILWRNWCPLAIHSFLGHTKAVQFLLSLADESAESRKEAEVSLRLAIDRGHAGIARQILAAKIGATVDSIFDDFTTPLSCAVAASNLKIVQILFEAGQKVNNENLLCNVLRGKSADFKFQGLSAGIPASLHADVSEIVVLLLREGANINQLSVHGERPLIVAVEFFNFEGVRALLDSDSGEYKGKDRLWQEAFSTNYRKLNLEERLDINAKDVQGNAALHLIRGASPNFPSPGNLLEHEQFDFRMNEQLKIIKYLLAKGADPNIMADNNFTPLHSAVAALQLEIVEELLKHGANIHGRPSQKTPPLHSIFQSLECKAPIGYKPVFKTPCSCKSIHDMLDLLLKNGANIDARTTDGELNSTLHLAVSWNNLLVVDYLLDHGANIEAINKEGYTPLLVAVRYQQYLSVQRLLEHGADINAQDSFKFTSLHWTIFQDDPDMLLLLLRYHPNLNLLDTWSRTALHIAAGLGNQYSTVLLLGAGAEVNLSDERGLTPLHCAIECGFLDTFWILLMAQSPKSAATQANRRGTLGYAYSIKEQPENDTDFAFSDQESEEGSENNIISGRSSQVEPADHIKPDEELPKEHVKLDSRGDLGVRFTRGTTLPLSPSRTYGKSHPHSGRHTLRPKPTFWPPPINDLRASRGGESSINNSSLRADYFLLREDLSDASEGLDIVSDSSSLNEESLAFSKSENGSEPLEGPSSSDDGSQGSEFPSIITGPTVRTFNPLSPTSDTKLEKEEREVYGDDDRSMSDASQETNSPRRSNAHRPRPPPSIHSSEEQGLEENSSGKISERSLSASFGSIHRLPRRSHRTHMGYVYEYDVTGPASRHGPYLHNLNDDYIQDRNGSSSSKSRSNHSPSQTLQESCFMNTGRSCMLFIRKVYSDLLMQRSLNLPGWNRTSRTDFKWILSLLEREKHLFEDSESDSTIENRFLLKYSPSREDNGGSQKAGATKNHYHGENSYQDSQIWLPSSIFHPSRISALEMLI